MHVYLTTNPHGNVFGGAELDTLPHFVWKNITFGDWSESRTVEYEVKLPKVCPSSMLPYAFRCSLAMRVLPVGAA